MDILRDTGPRLARGINYSVRLFAAFQVQQCPNRQGYHGLKVNGGI